MGSFGRFFGLGLVQACIPPFGHPIFMESGAIDAPRGPLWHISTERAKKKIEKNRPILSFFLGQNFEYVLTLTVILTLNRNRNRNFDPKP